MAKFDINVLINAREKSCKIGRDRTVDVFIYTAEKILKNRPVPGRLSNSPVMCTSLKSYDVSFFGDRSIRTFTGFRAFTNNNIIGTVFLFVTVSLRQHTSGSFLSTYMAHKVSIQASYLSINLTHALSRESQRVAAALINVTFLLPYAPCISSDTANRSN